LDIKEIVENLAFISLKELKKKEILSTFDCKESDIKDFLYNKALKFEERGVSRTYIFIDTLNQKVFGYFSLSHIPVETANLSKTKIKEIDGFSKERKCLNFFLIGQLGLDDQYRGFNVGTALLDRAIDIIREVSYQIGGRYILVDAIKNEKVTDFYQNNGFVKLLEDKDTVKMIYKI